MGETARGRREFRKEALASRLQKDRSRKIDSICGEASGCLSKGDRGGIWVQRYGNLSGYEASENHPKKKTTGYREQDEKKVAAYQEEIRSYPMEKIAYVDECGIDTYLHREYGYATRGQKVFNSVGSAVASTSDAESLRPR